MPNMTAGYRNAIATYGASLITHIGLVDNTGTELAGGDPAYARKSVVWVAADNGIVRPNADIVFDVPAGSNVSGWRGYSALAAGTDYGGKSVTRRDSVGQATYNLEAALTAIKHE